MRLRIARHLLRRSGRDNFAALIAAFRAEIEQFFKVYKDLEGLPTQTAGFGDRGEAFRVLAEARARSAAAETGR